jgi:hypothetical protein
MKGTDSWKLELKAASRENLLAKVSGLGKNAELNSIHENDNHSYVITLSSKDNSLSGEQLFDWAVSSSFKILSMNKKNMSIEDIFVKLTSDANKKDEGVTE